MEVMKMIMKFYNCPDEIKNHPNIKEFEIFSKFIKKANFL